MNHSLNADTVAMPQSRRQPRTRTRIVTALGLTAIILLTGLGVMLYRMAYVPNNLDTSTSLISQQGLYHISYLADTEPVPVNQIHTWTLRVEDAHGRPAENAEIRVDGDMPGHGHGLPTRPQVTASLGSGEYRVEGLKFHMPGWWVVDFYIEQAGQSDQVRFNMILK